MANSTGTYSSINDALSKLLTFLTANGWTQDTYTTDGGAGSYKACVHKGSMYVNMRTLNAEANTTVFQNGMVNGGTYTMYGIALYAGTGNGASGSPWYNGAGAPVGSGAAYNNGVVTRVAGSGAGTYFFLLDSTNDNFLCVLEHTPGVYVNFGWGTSFNKAGTVTGGMYFFGTFAGYEANVQAGSPTYGISISQNCPMILSPHSSTQGAAAFIRADVDAFTSKWIGISVSASAGYGWTGRIGETDIYGNTAGSAIYPRRDNIQDRTYNASNGSPILLPVQFYSPRDAGGYSLLGSLPNIFATKAVGNGWNAEDEITIGADTYKLFPNFAVKKVA